MARKLAIDSKAVAYAVIGELLAEPETEILWDNQDSNGIADHVLQAADVEFQPRARKLILTFDLSGEPGSLELPPAVVDVELPDATNPAD
ncbi:hypothetical protein ABZX12_18515 [Kribbella sp. NPDC003505]|uniref:hypothetical protein n=1 Tax=Kribbella sp. NPDC003505 TaxID=3154448 RepID=UPI0033B80FC5